MREELIKALQNIKNGNASDNDWVIVENYVGDVITPSEFNALLNEYKGGTQETNTTQTNNIVNSENTGVDEVSLTDRTIVKNLANSTEEALQYLAKRYPNLDFFIRDNEIYYKNPNTNETKALDPEGLDAGDFSDILYDAMYGGAQVIGGLGGALATAYSPITAVLGSITGSTMAGTALKELRDKLRKKYGFRDDNTLTNNITESATDAVLGEALGGLTHLGLKGVGKTLGLSKTLKNLGKWFYKKTLLPYEQQVVKELGKEPSQTLTDIAIKNNIKGSFSNIAEKLQGLNLKAGKNIEKIIDDISKQGETIKASDLLEPFVNQVKKEQKLGKIITNDDASKFLSGIKKALESITGKKIQARKVNTLLKETENIELTPNQVFTMLKDVPYYNIFTKTGQQIPQSKRLSGLFRLNGLKVLEDKVGEVNPELYDELLKNKELYSILKAGSFEAKNKSLPIELYSTFGTSVSKATARNPGGAVGVGLFKLLTSPRIFTNIGKGVHDTGVFLETLPIFNLLSRGGNVIGDKLLNILNYTPTRNKLDVAILQGKPLSKALLQQGAKMYMPFIRGAGYGKD